MVKKVTRFQNRIPKESMTTHKRKELMEVASKATNRHSYPFFTVHWSTIFCPLRNTSFKIILLRVERRCGGYEHRLLFQMMQLQFPELTTTCNASSNGCSAFGLPLRAPVLTCASLHTDISLYNNTVKNISAWFLIHWLVKSIPFGFRSIFLTKG